MTGNGQSLERGNIYRSKSKLLVRYWLRVLRWRHFPRLYVLAALAILAGSVLYWSMLSAKVQLNNADSLVDAYLFKDVSTFHGATFPGQHTQLIKWPLFFIIKLLGLSSSNFVIMTVLVVLLTVFALVLILHRIEHRPLVFGALCLALASVLLLIPALPYASGLLPVNMAMLTTRNLEYIVYLAALILLARTRRIKSWSFWLATICLVLLIASDKLFLTLGLGASFLALVVYALVRKWELVSLATYWLVAQLLATGGALALLGIINVSHLTHITNQSSAGPYSLVTNFHSLVIGSLYAISGLFTNFGANPAFDATTLKSVPHLVVTRLISLSDLAFLVNALLLVASFYAAIRLLRNSLKQRATRSSRSVAEKTSLMLLWTTGVAGAVFILSSHDYVVDARYLTIALFTLPVVGATYVRPRHWRPERLVGIGAILLVTITIGLLTATHISNDEQAALATVNQRNAKIVAATSLHRTSILVGDYWRVIPIKLKTQNTLAVMPLTDCTSPRTDLSSSVWQPDLHNRSFTYLLSYDQKLTNYPNCTLHQVVQAYGRPNASLLVAGSTDNPKEQLLFYDRGINKSAPLTPQPARGPATVVPITLDELPNTSCPVPDVMAIVAHEDDDLFFMNPDLLHVLQAGYCLQTVYITAGDGGFGEYYWLNRQLGEEAAYSKMLGTDDVWVERIVKLADNEFATIATPRGHKNMSLVFLHLPDGNLQGQGFGFTHHESLAKLFAHQIPVMHSVDGQSTYTADQLIKALGTLMGVYSPAEIYTQSTYTAPPYPDHSDHVTVGKFTTFAYKEYEKLQFNNLVTIPISYYIGYPIHAMPPNIFGGDLEVKTAIFLTYAQYDGGVCHTSQVCQETLTFGSYLSRQYKSPY